MKLSIEMTLYLISLVLFTLAFLKLNHRLERLGFLFLTIGLIVHSLTFLNNLVNNEVILLRLVMLTLVTLTGAGMYVIMSLRYRLSYSHVFFVSPTLILCFFYKPQLVGTTIPVAFSVHLLHFISSVLALSSLTISFIAAILYLIQHSQLKNKTFGFWTKRLPPLSTLDEVGFLATLFGFLSLTVAILSGGFRIHDGQLAFFAMGSREWIIFAAWLVYALYFRIRYSVGYLGSKLAWVAVWCYLVQIFALFIMIGLHQFS